MNNRISASACLLFLIGTFLSAPLKGQTPSTKSGSKGKILFVITSHGQVGDTDKETGYYLSEVTHPWEVLVQAGYEIDFVSPQGGESPIDGYKPEDPVNKAFLQNEEYQSKIKQSMTPSEVNPEDYVAIHYAGGHGTMWDFADNEALARIAAHIYEDGGVVSAVCHGPAGLLNVKLSNGDYLLDGKTVSGFTNEEEKATGLDQVVPFLLETEMRARGGQFEKAGRWKEKVSVDGRLVTGQNPASAKGVGEAVLEVLERLSTPGN